MIEAFCEQYLGENYDYVFAVHRHAHGILFLIRSQPGSRGISIVIKKGDREKEIQPITANLNCRGTWSCETETYDKQQKIGKSYAEYQAEKEGRYTLKKIIDRR